MLTTDVHVSVNGHNNVAVLYASSDVCSEKKRFLGRLSCFVFSPSAYAYDRCKGKSTVCNWSNNKNSLTIFRKNRIR